MSDHPRIWLEPAPGADPDYGRQWCQHGVWEDGTEYVRADLACAAHEQFSRAFGEAEADKIIDDYRHSPNPKNTGKQTMPEGKSDDLMEAAIRAVDAAREDLLLAKASDNKALLRRVAISVVHGALVAEHERCNAILKAAFGTHITVDSLEASIATKWQPIGTAPLDGTLVDLWAYRGECGKSGIRPAERYADCRFAKNSYGTEPYGEPRWQGLNDRYITVTPTHWMPIPSGPPSTEENLQHD